uniref:ABC-type branched-chain amino acid transport systems, ATPase component n=1 Tax=Candidatus Actinomarina minuta TaxID=1389454 RepID=S5DKY6_9ACTN|nr:ABC-type branched-chain amino acid transport systems, ATPase component [Candidatus Actinomarina minuta]
MALINSLINFNNVNLNFGGVNALTEVSFDIKENSLFAIIGPNGAGKTSIFNCISGIYRPTSGKVKIFDQDIKTMRPDAIANLGVSRTFQNIELFENMTTLDNILIGAHRHIDYGSIAGLLFSKKARKEEEKARKIAEDIIDFLEIEEYRYSYILSLPYGIQKRIELARALAMKPKVLLLDEPAAGMNNEETEDIARFILDIHEELGVTVVLIDHDMNMVMDIATEVIVMDFGKKLFDGNPKEASKDKNVIEAYLGVSE